MSERKTRRDVEGMLRRAMAAARAAGVPTPDAVGLHAGSKTNGNTWQVEGWDAVEFPGWGRTSLGWTAAEAYQTLYCYALAWESQQRNKDDQ